ncbi:HpcH/HpaI aldolase family protein [Paraburkholderia sacchari]|uniref:HpcH/HpaI aldolase family protein n=1 Tax=Paraburkholderia sacchari TaxID=159450 RepID=UPI001BCA9E3A|nr:aldolase/citrate lyase family protein [Paraburkholderia sacchari]
MLEHNRPLDTRLPVMLRSGERLRGIFNGLPSPAIVEMCGYAGFDFVVLDNEHGSSDLQVTEHMLRAARASAIPAIVRCFEADIARILDMGASGVKVPMVNTAAQARALVQRVRYPSPAGQSGGGQRGVAFSSRAAGYGAFGGSSHTASSNEGVALIVMLETPQALENAAEIAGVPGVDAVFIGPNDLSHSMGYGPDWSAPAVQRLIERALRAISGAGGCGGMLAMSEEEEERYAAWGARYFATVSTALIMRAFGEAASHACRKLAY